MKNKGIWKALLYFGVAVLAVVCLFLLRGTSMDTYSTEEYNSVVTHESFEATCLMFAAAMLGCVLFCKAIRADVLGVGQALITYAGITIPLISLFLPDDVLHLRRMGLGVMHSYYAYRAFRGAVLGVDTVCMFGVFVLLVMIFGSTKDDYKEKVKKAILGVGIVTLVLGLASMGFKTSWYNSWLLVVSVLSVLFGCVVLFLCWTGKMLQFSLAGSIKKWMCFDYDFEEDDESDEEEDE